MIRGGVARCQNHLDDWECTSSGRPIPQFAAGTGTGAYPLDWRSRPDKKYGSSHVSGVSKPAARRKFVGADWIHTPDWITPVGTFVPAPPPNSPRPTAGWHSSRSGAQPKRMAQVAAKTETDVACGLRMVQLPKECIIVGREKAVWRAGHAAEWQHELDRRDRDRVIVLKNRQNKLRQELATT